MNARTKIGKDGRVTLPEDVMRALDLHEGDDLEASIGAAGEVVLRRAPEPKRTGVPGAGLLGLIGAFKTQGPQVSPEERRRLIGEAILRKGRE